MASHVRFLAGVGLLVVAIGLMGFRGDVSSLDDQQIAAAIRQRLAMDGRVDAKNIQIKVEQGNVTLSGTVPSVEDKALAESIVSGTIVGVKALTNAITVVPPVVADDHIRVNVEAALRSLPVLQAAKVKDVEVLVNNGIVTLKGSVEKPVHRRAAEKAAEAVKGVKGVANLLKVVGKLRPDREIEHDLVTYLQWSPIVDLDAVEYQVENGLVKIKGTIDHIAHKYTLARDIEKIDGVVDVDVSGLRVTNARRAP